MAPQAFAGLLRTVMPYKYECFSDVSKSEMLDRDFRVRLLVRPGATIVIAPHGGGIEPGTSELAEAIAGGDFSFYAFDGIKPAGSGNLHITSTRFDEPKCLALVRLSPQVISIHGEESEAQTVFLGGLGAEASVRLRDSLKASGFRVEIHDDPSLQGRNAANICNRAKTPAAFNLSWVKDCFARSPKRSRHGTVGRPRLNPLTASWPQFGEAAADLKRSNERVHLHCECV
jgi:phage replication-related protein YjqB (UPF0714/DUF867 family)